MNTNISRHLPLEGGFNFRDLGGYRTSEGKIVKWRKIFRSDDLALLTDADLDFLKDLSIATIVDFRSDEEIAKAPDRIPSSVRKVYPYSIKPGNLNTDQMMQLSNQIPMDEMMTKMYELLVKEEETVRQYKKFFSLLHNVSDNPILFHCSAGKDRTGLASALLLSALGVDEKTIMDDYLLSNRYILRKYASLLEKYPNFQPAFEVESRYLENAWNVIKQDFGSIDHYLKEKLNVNIPLLRKNYLE